VKLDKVKEETSDGWKGEENTMDTRHQKGDLYLQISGLGRPSQVIIKFRSSCMVKPFAGIEAMA
jgi:hypothetical protein